MFQQFKAHNESKNIFKAAKTPAVFFAIAVLFYIASGVFGLLGVYSMANFCNLLMGLALVTLITWAYIRYSGEMVEFGRRLDEVALLLWEGVSLNLIKVPKSYFCFQFMKPIYQQFVQKSLEQAAISAATSAAASATGSSSIVNGKMKSS